MPRRLDRSIKTTLVREYNAKRRV
ncbi:uncharacterized protein G2W53_009822 [Senna tora]|uniref:Uncharacterized protein n=1 Tax=Senna tora TaxID=362788 RepID=A0A834WZ20_9FABA|nr:uncharacterized protein G2W53_009822 [Senna tora]